jgi:tetratricopeptide (TPR) repeat protein
MLARTSKTLLLVASVAAIALPGCVSGPSSRVERPDHPLMVRAEQAYLAGDRDSALADYRAYRTGFAGGPWTSDAYYWEGVLLLEKGDAAQAEHAFDECLRQPRNRTIEAQAQIGRGDCFFVRDRFDEAIGAYQRGLDLRAPDVRTDYCLYRLAAARQRHGDWAQGRSCYELLLRDFPRSLLAARTRQRLEYPDQAYHIQVGALADEESARNLAGYVQSKGVQAKVVRTGAGETPWLVWVGAYTQWDEARGALGEVQQICGREAALVP